MTHIRLHQLTKTFGGVGLHPTDLEIEPGEPFVLVGPSGAGKSTLLRLIAGLETPDAGTMHFDDQRIDHLPPHRREVGFIPQRPALLPHLTVAENLTFAGGSPQSAREAAALLRIDHLLARHPDGLSQGERQRAALGRLLTRQYRVWLLDEPFAALDFGLRQQFRDELLLLQRQSNTTMLFVTHDPIEGLALGRRIGVLADGVIRQVGSPAELTHNPADLRVASCLGWPTLNRIPGTLAANSPDTTEFRSHDESVVLTLPARIAAGRCVLSIRPENVRLTQSRNALPLGRWEHAWTEPVGPATVAVLRRGDTLLRVWQPEQPHGDVFAENIWIFDEATGTRLKTDEHERSPTADDGR